MFSPAHWCHPAPPSCSVTDPIIYLFISFLPRHYYRVDLRDGTKWYQGAERDEEGKLVPGSWKSVGERQRVHEVQARPDGLWVRLNLAGSLASDEYACRHECGSRLHGNHLRLHLPDRQREASPGRGSPSTGGASPPASPLASPKFWGSEDVWPEDLPAGDSERRHSGHGHSSMAHMHNHSPMARRATPPR